MPIEVPYTTTNNELCDLAYAYEGDAGLDLHSRISATLQPGQRMGIPTGVSLAIPEGYAGLVVPRSGLALKHGITVVNAPGLIDSGYRGEIVAILLNTDATEPFIIEPGDRIAQLLLVPFAQAILTHVNELPDSTRGTNGFGSSGV